MHTINKHNKSPYPILASAQMFWPLGTTVAWDDWVADLKWKHPPLAATKVDLYQNIQKFPQKSVWFQNLAILSTEVSW